MEQKITPCLWFDDNAEEAALFYTSVFKNTKIVQTTYYGEGGPKPKGTALTVIFELEGQEYMALNGGPYFTFSPAISLHVKCHSQEQVDELWHKLADGGEPKECGWLRDKYGVSWQIVPTILGELLNDPNEAKAQSVMQAMLKMKKIDINALWAAYRQV